MELTKAAGNIRVCLWGMFLLFLIQVQSYAQTPALRTEKITGKITSKINGSPISGATVSVKGTMNVVLTDDKGEFSISASPEETLIISNVGYLPREVKVGTLRAFNLTLSESYNHLDDVVVVGYGKTKKSDLSSAVGTVTSTELERTVNTTIDQALQGRAANVYVSSPSGQPGAGSSVIIRGISSITGNSQPLYVIDGVQIRPGAPTGGAYNQPAGYANELSSINPDDIDNISILQGAAATSIFGAAGSNGVLMITTKHGKAGQTRVTASSLFSLQDKPKFRPVMDLQQYARYIQKLETYGAVGYEAPELSDPSILGKGTNWQDELFKRTLLEKYSLSLSGGSEKSTFFVSGDYLKQNGMAKGSGFTRGSIRLNIDNQATKWLKFGLNVTGGITKEIVNTTNGNIINLAITQNPTIPVKNPDGSWGGPISQQAQYSQTNPVAIAALNNNYNTALDVLGNAYVDINPIKGLVWHTELNGNDRYYNNYQFNPAYTIGSYVNPNTTGSRDASNNTWWSFNTRVQYDYKYRKHAASAMVGHEAQYYTYQNLHGEGQNYSTTSIQELSVADPLTQKTTSGRNDGAQESYFARVNYEYNDRYIAQFVVRRDGNSSFGPDNRFGTFPAASVAWRVSQENFMKSLTFINELKIRGEYGISGNSNGSGGAIYSRLYAAATPWGGGFSPANYPNPELKWEQDQSTNIGFDLNMFNNRVEVIGDVYVKNITNLILIDAHAGYLGGNLSGGYGGNISWPVQNIGSMQNKGFGVTVNTVNVNSKDFQWRTGVNFSVDKNEVKKITTPQITQYYSSTNSNQAEFLTEVGQPLSMITGYIAEGLFKNYQDISTHAIQTTSSTGAPVLTIDPKQGSWPGDVKFKDIGGPNGSKKPDGIIDQNDRTIIGNPWPKFTYNFNNTFSYKGFELNLFFTGVYGNQLLNLTRYQNEMPLGTGPYSNHYQSVANFAVPSSNDVADALTVTLTNPGHDIPRVVTNGDPNGNVRLTQWDVESGSYLKLKNVRLSYRIPGKYLSSTHVFRGITAVIQAQNVFTITKYTGFDPEVGLYQYKGVTNIAGLDEGRYPSTRSYSASLVLDF